MDEQIFQEELQERTERTREIIGGIFEKTLQPYAGVPYLQTLTEAMDYSFLAGGKRLRPLIMWETFRMLGGDSLAQNRARCEALEVFMTALEMIHTYSLVHDDLPAMDNDEYRRGKLTTWKKYGDGFGVLTGDGLMNAAFEAVFECIAQCALSEDRTLTAAVSACGAILAKKAGISGMLGGQAADVEAEEQAHDMTEEELLFIHTNKTAALLECAMEIGAILADATREQCEAVSRVARNVGLAFQIQDDILDVIGDSRELGKKVGSDQENGKKTYVDLKGLEQSKQDVEKLSDNAILILQTLPGEKEFLEELIRHLVNRRK